MNWLVISEGDQLTHELLRKADARINWGAKQLVRWGDALTKKKKFMYINWFIFVLRIGTVHLTNCTSRIVLGLGLSCHFVILECLYYGRGVLCWRIGPNPKSIS